MSGAVYYNEKDAFAAAWLRRLADCGLVPTGDVDERDIRDVFPDDLRGYTACHFFAGIGGWPYALRLAGWPDARPIWTGSCPCQPFSTAGRGAGVADERHLWPHWFHLIEICRPRTVLGEQVASKDGLAWLDLVSADLEGAGYARGAIDLCAAGVGAPHIRQRLWFVADAGRPGLEIERIEHARAERPTAERGGAAGGLGNAECVGPGRDTGASAGTEGGAALRPERHDAGAPSTTDGVGFAGRTGSQPRHEATAPLGHRSAPVAAGNWDDSEWLPCRDGKSRPTQPGILPLAHGIPARVGRVRGYGNAIVPQVAAEVIGAFMECAP